MSNPIRWDDPRNSKMNREVREKSNTSSISPKDFVRLQAERTKRADGIEKSMAKQKEAQDQIDKQLVNRENKDINSPDSPFVRTKEYEDMRVKTLQAAEGRMKESAVPDSLNVEQGLSRKRQIELSQQAINAERVIRYSMQKPAVDTKPESDTSTPVSDNPHASIYQREIEQIQELIDTGKPVYAYFNRREGSAYITDNVEKAQARFGDDAIANLQPGDQRNGIQRIELEHAKMGIQDKEYGLKPELDITAPQVEKSQDTGIDAIRATDGTDAQREARQEMLEALERTRKEDIIEKGWGDLLKLEGKGTTLYWKESSPNRETFYFEDQKNRSIRASFDEKDAHANEESISLLDAAKKVREEGFKVTSEDPIYAARYDDIRARHPNDHSSETKFLITTDEDAIDHMVNTVGYRRLSEGKTEYGTSVKDFVGADRLNELPEWMHKFNIEDFAEYRPDLKAEDFMQLAQNKPLEHETIPADARRVTGETNAQGADIGERLSQVKKEFTEADEGKEFNKLKKDLDVLYERISKSSVSKEISQQAEAQKDRAEMYPIQIEAFFKLKEVNPSLNEQYEVHYNRMVNDMQESVEFMEEALDQSRRQDIPASSKFESKGEFVSSVESVMGKKGNSDKNRQFSEKVYDNLKAKGVDETRIRLSIGMIEKNKEDITAWLEDGQKTESDINRASNWLMNQVDQLSQRRNDAYKDDPYTDARRKFGSEMDTRRTGQIEA